MQVTLSDFYNQFPNEENQFLDTGQVLELFTLVGNRARDAGGLTNATGTV
jgi:hypothetical protein